MTHLQYNERIHGLISNPPSYPPNPTETSKRTIHHHYLSPLTHLTHLLNPVQKQSTPFETIMTDGIIRAAGTSGGPAAVDDDFAEEGMQCSRHPCRNNASNGGICALCLQEKLGKLVSSSLFNVASSSSSSSPSFRSDPSAAANAASLSLTLSLRPAAAASAASLVSSSSSTTNGQNKTSTTTTRRARIPFLLSHKKKKSTAEQNPNNQVLKRSKSAVFPRRRPSSAGEDYSNAIQKRGGFWSFLYYSKPKPEKPPSSASSSARDLKAPAQPHPPAVAVPAPAPPSNNGVTPAAASSSKRAEYVVVVDEGVDSPSSGSSNATSFGRKVSRSRSVGCGSRSFSGDFFERITTGFGDCTLRRVESQREGKRRSSGDAIIKEKVRCGGIFSGFMMTSSSSSSSDRLSAGDQEHQVSGKGSTAPAPALQGRSKSWRWALASPMRALGRPSPSSSAKELKASASKSNATPNFTTIPSLLTVR